MDEDLVNIRIGKNIRHRRTELGMSLKQLGEVMGLSYQQVQKYESGRNALSATRLMQLATVFACSVDEICEFEIAAAEKGRWMSPPCCGGLGKFMIGRGGRKWCSPAVGCRL